MKHKHCDLIVAWANGAEIEYTSPILKEWHIVSPRHSWDSDLEYRIKPPEPVKKVVYAAVAATSLNRSAFSESPTTYDNLKFTFIDNKLVKAEVLQ